MDTFTEMKISIHPAYRYAFATVISVMGCAFLFSCASPGRPSGGPRDEDPPRFIGSTVPLGATDVNAERIVLRFNELVNVKDAFSKVVISPTSAKTPRITSNGRNVYINFQDTLAPNTTYTVDFGNAIEDNNEGNKMSSFAYWFSTGPDIDTLRISGMVLAADNLEPQQSMIVGVYSQSEDSLFKTTRLERIAKTDDRGRFVLRGLKPGAYRLFALADANNDYKWDNPQEDIAFTDFTVTPTTERRLVQDTIYDLRTGQIDTIVDRMRTVYLPNTVLLNSFNINFNQQYLVKSERLDSTRFSFIFNAPADSLPALRLLDFPDITDWFVLDRSAGNDTLTYWIKNPELIHTDTLRIGLGYNSHDKQLNLVPRVDTLKMLTVRPKVNKKQAKKNNKDSVEEAQPVFLEMRIGASGSHDVNTPVTVEFGQPLQQINRESFHIEVMKDSLWLPVVDAVGLVPTDTLTTRRYKMEYPWEYDTKYRVTVDTLAATGIYGNVSRPAQQEFTIRKQSEYFDLRFRITSLPDSVPAFVELLDGQDKPVRRAPVYDGIASFTDIPLGTYYARLIEDRNGNGRWDTGSYDDHLQPEYVYYYPKALKVTKRWDIDNPWDLTATAIDLQKPAAIKKNKPEVDKKSRNRSNEENEESEDDDVFDPTRNPFDPNDRGRRRSTAGSY